PEITKEAPQRITSVELFIALIHLNATLQSQTSEQPKDHYAVHTKEFSISNESPAPSTQTEAIRLLSEALRVNLKRVSSPFSTPSVRTQLSSHSCVNLQRASNP